MAAETVITTAPMAHAQWPRRSGTLCAPEPSALGLEGRVGRCSHGTTREGGPLGSTPAAMARSQAGAVGLVLRGRKGSSLVRGGPGLVLHIPSGAGRLGVTLFRVPLRCLGDGRRAAGCLEARWEAARAQGAPCCALAAGRPRSLSRNAARWRAAEERDVTISASPPQSENTKGSFSLSGSRKLYFDTHALVCLLEANGFTTQQSEIIVSALMNIMKSNTDVIYKDMVTKIQQEIALQQIMSHIGVVKKDMIILEKSEFSALRAENEKIKLELQQLKKQVTDETSKVRTDSKLDFNLEKSRVKELYSLNDRKLLKMRTEIVEMHAHQDRALTQTDRKIDTEVAGLKTMLESHKLDNIKYLAGSVFTCLTVALGFYRLWV